jgi:acyl-CoA thioester hydrolase
MARVKINFPDHDPLFRTTIPVRIGDINYGGHVGNDSFLSLVHEVRMQWLRSKGYDELNAGGVSLIMADVMIAYKAEAFYGDELEAEVYAGEITNTSFDLLYCFSTMRNGGRNDVLHAKTGMICFDYQARRIRPMTDPLRTLIGT